MSIIDALAKRRSYYNINRELPVEIDQVFDLVDKITELVPDAFNMKSSRVVVVTGEHQDKLWDTIYDVFEGKVSREKIDGFKTGNGTILYFYDADVVANLQEQFPNYAHNFPLWANQAVGMLQISIWSALRELNIGASLQHYNPVIDDAVKKMFDLPASWTLNAQMPFGGIESEPEPKESENIRERVRIIN
ncbi:MAG TPA: nitroreductase family protein [Clostridiaceae bacterium]|nr:nitroreductase family protein [Clostridiaceae bacterium]